MTLENGTASSRAALSNRINDAAAISMRGAWLTLNGRDNAVVEEKAGDLILESDKNSIGVGLGSTGVRSAELRFGTLSVHNDATLFFLSNGAVGSASRIFFTNGESLLQNAIFPFAVGSGIELASYVSGLGAVSLNTVGARGYDASFVPSESNATNNLRLSGGSFTIPSGTYEANAIAFKPNAAGQGLVFQGEADVLNLTSGVLLANLNGMNSIGSAPGQGRIVAGGSLAEGTAPLYLTAV
jgi:hypothetical protein